MSTAAELKKAAVVRGQGLQAFVHEAAELPKDAWEALRNAGTVGVTYAAPVAGSQVFAANALMRGNSA